MNDGKSTTLVMKFGGTSVGTPDAMRMAAHIVQRERERWPRVVVVTSALSGVTNLLLDAITGVLRGDPTVLSSTEAQLRKVHTDIVDQMISDPESRNRVLSDINGLLATFTNLCQAIMVLGEATPRAADAVASLGERMSVRILAAVLETMGIPARFVEATELVVTDDSYQDAHPDLDATYEKTNSVLNPLLQEGIVPVVTGFIAATREGITTTLGRGGSDYSAALVGAALRADEVWIWTDVDGVMSADPRLVPEARTIPRLTFKEISELAYYGAKVLHPKTIRPVIEAGIGLRVCNTFSPDSPGTYLVGNGSTNGNGQIKAVSAIRSQKLVTIEGRGMIGIPGIAAKAFSAVASTGTSVPLITQASSEQSICFAVPVPVAGRVVYALEEAFQQELARKDIDSIWATDEVVIVTVVGAGMRHTPGVSGRIFSALGDRNVNVIAIAQGSSEVSISLVVDLADEKKALIALHELIVGKVE